MLVAGLVVNVQEENSVEICEYLQASKIAEIPNIDYSSSFACVVEADSNKELEQKIELIKAIDGICSISISFKADENDDNLGF